MKNFHFDQSNPKKAKEDFKKHCPGEDRALMISINGILVKRKVSGEIVYYEKGKEIKL